MARRLVQRFLILNLRFNATTRRHTIHTHTPSIPLLISNNLVRHCSIAASSKDELANITGKLQIIYTCNVCQTRSSKVFSKQAYGYGVVLVRCPGCEKLHLVADNLGWFGDKKSNVESILAEKGESLKKIMTADGTVELIAQ